MDTATTGAGIGHPAVLMIIEGRVPAGGKAALEAFYADAHTLFDSRRSMLLRLQWNSDEGLQFRVVFEYVTEDDFEHEDIRARTDPDVLEYWSRLGTLVERQPAVTIWRETSRQFSEDLVRAYWDLVDAREWDALHAILAPDVVLEWPASNERLVGADNLVAANRDTPDGWTVRVHSIVAGGEQVASDVEELLDNGESFRVVTIWTVRHQRIVSGTEFWTAVGQTHTPPWRRGHSTAAS